MLAAKHLPGMLARSAESWLPCTTSCWYAYMYSLTLQHVLLASYPTDTHPPLLTYAIMHRTCGSCKRAPCSCWAP